MVQAAVIASRALHSASDVDHFVNANPVPRLFQQSFDGSHPAVSFIALAASISRLVGMAVPSSVADKLAASEGGSLVRLLDLGLIDVFEDLVDRRQAAFSVNALVAGRLEPLSDSDRQSLAEAIAQTLFRAWGGVDGEKTRASACELELTRLGLLAEDGEVVAATATGAVLALRQGPAAIAAAFGRKAIALLDAQRRPAPWRLLSETASALSTMGDGATADTLLERGVAALDEQRRLGVAIDPVAASFLVWEQANRLKTRGELDQGVIAESSRKSTLSGVEELGAGIS